MKIVRTGILIKSDIKRVLLRPFIISNEERVIKVLRRIMDLSDTEISNQLSSILSDFGRRHKELKSYFLNRYEQQKIYLPDEKSISEERKLLIGAYFTMEYSLEAAALFNPSMVWHPDQSNLPEGNKRFIISLRAVGEGHISSVTFRTGTVDPRNNLFLDNPSEFTVLPESVVDSENNGYNIKYGEDSFLPEQIIFPHSLLESNGIEDARFVEFYNNDERIYYASFTAYNGKAITPGLLETKDFLRFSIRYLTGKEAVNKGFALFPEKINGQYGMLSRQDNENNYIMFSDSLYEWNSKKIIVEPEFSWELIQLGNCGSPIKTDAGWLVLSHGVGAMRKYSIGAFLLDLNDPSRVIGRLKEPLLTPDENEREGYVPNVVYSCGGLLNNGDLIIPYAMSDYATSFARVNLNSLLNEMS